MIFFKFRNIEAFSFCLAIVQIVNDRINYHLFPNHALIQNGKFCEPLKFKFLIIQYPFENIQNFFLWYGIISQKVRHIQENYADEVK